jgi:hypothetical protein
MTMSASFLAWAKALANLRNVVVLWIVDCNYSTCGKSGANTYYFSLTLRLGINNLLEEYAQALPDDPRLLLRKAHSLELGAISLGLLTYQPDGNVVDYHSHNR